MSGSCQCGAVHYQVTASRLVAYACHCRECQKQSASAFGLSVPVKTAEVILSGTPACYERPAASGAATRCYFCETCGTRLYHKSSSSPGILTLKGGTLNNPEALPLVAHLWTSRKHPWIALPADMEQYETQPDDLKAWRDHLLNGSRQDGGPHGPTSDRS